MTPEELNKVLEEVKKTAQESYRALRDEEARTEAALTKDKKIDELLANVSGLTQKISALETGETVEKQKTGEEILSQFGQISQKLAALETKTVETDGRIKTVCEVFPSLCEKVEALAKKLDTPPPVALPPAEPPKDKKKGILDTGHENIEDLLNCPECLLGHIRKIGLDKASEEICKDDESCKATIAELTKKGYKIEEPKKEGASEGKDEEGKEGDGSFTLGQGTKETPVA